MSPKSLSPERDEDPVVKTMSLRQLALAVSYGRKISFHIFDNDPVTGYLAAMDDTFFLVLMPVQSGTSFIRKLVARSSITLVDLHDVETYSSEPCRTDMEEIVAPFRSWIVKNLLGRQEPRAPRKVG